MLKMLALAVWVWYYSLARLKSIARLYKDDGPLPPLRGMNVCTKGGNKRWI